ncbi:MAG: YqjF family protein [Gemmatimonadaceae bacterium]
MPSGPWAWRQVWNDLAFLHWPVSASLVAPLIPRGLTVDEYDGSAWIAVVPFWMSGVTMRGVPPLPGLSSFPELNVRTYVRHGDRPGIWFFSLDAASRLTVFGGRLLFMLPYCYAIMHAEEREGRIQYSSIRSAETRFVASYGPTGPVRKAEPGSLPHFLTERYRLYAAERDTLFFADIHHEQWPLQPGEVEIERNDMLAANRLSAAGAPIVHFAKRLDVVIWPLRKLVR